MPDDVEVLRYKIETLSNVLGDIKVSVQKVQEFVGTIKIIEVKNMQTVRDLERLEQVVKMIQKKIETADADILSEMKSCENSLDSKIKTTCEKLEVLNYDWKEKYSFIRGAFLALTLISGIMSSIGWYVVKQQLDRIDEIGHKIDSMQNKK